MNLVRQPEGSNQCGQACVAMVLGIYIQDAIAIMGTKGKTRTKQLSNALQTNGVECPSRLVRGWPPQGADAILKVTDDDHSHWIVRVGRWFYDPACGRTREFPFTEARVTSHLPINIKESDNDNGGTGE